MKKSHALLLCLIIANVFVFIVYTVITTPVVEFSHSTGQCVAVYSYSDDYSCSNLPARYEHVLVK